MEQPSFQFSSTAQPSLHSARIIVPKLLSLIGPVDSVVDLGGGCGGWLAAFKENGAKRVFSVDHPAIEESDLLIDRSEFIPCDLDREIPAVISASLAMSIECAEHLPPERSTMVVDYLTSCSDLVLFSAAVPKQGGCGHLNEQWPDYWGGKFQEKGYEQFDVVRPKIIFEPEVLSWLKQNLFLYCKKGTKHHQTLSAIPPFLPQDFVLIEKRILDRPPGVKDLLKELAPAFKRMIQRRL